MKSKSRRWLSNNVFEANSSSLFVEKVTQFTQLAILKRVFAACNGSGLWLYYILVYCPMFPFRTNLFRLISVSVNFKSNSDWKFLCFLYNNSVSCLKKILPSLNQLLPI